MVAGLNRHDGFMQTIKTDHPAETMTRPEAIARIRACLAAGETEEQCACMVASRYGRFCGGFSRLSDREFRECFHWIVRKRPGASRVELERLASLYHVGRQQATHRSLCCDVETREHCGCDGWNSFDDPTLERFISDLTGETVRIVKSSLSEKL